ncbi:MAG: polymorphic toxin type 5 domain-containing protein [Bacteroidota bacterium]
MSTVTELHTIKLTKPRDSIQEKIVRILSRPVTSGDNIAANKRVSEIIVVINSSDLASAKQLQRRLTNHKDRLSRFVSSRITLGTFNKLKLDLKTHIISLRVVSVPPKSQISLPNAPIPRVNPSKAIKPLIQILRQPVKSNSVERYKKVYRLFKSINIVNARRLLVRLETEGDELRAMFFHSLTKSRAQWLIDNVLKNYVHNLPVEQLPENLPSGELDTMFRRGVLKDGRGKTLSKETEEFRQEHFEVAAERGHAVTYASKRRLEDIQLEFKHPLPINTTRKIIKIVEENKHWLRTGKHRDVDKVALSKFLGQLKLLRNLSNKNIPFLYVLAVWSRLLGENYPKLSGTYLMVWTRWMGNYAIHIERAYKDKLSKIGYIWIQAISMPGPIEFMIELAKNGELFKLSNFKAAGLGIYDGFVSVAKGMVSLLDEDTWMKFYEDWEEHGSDFFTVFKADTIDLVTSQFARDFHAFALLDEKEQARTTSHILTASVIDKKIPGLTKKGLKAADKKITNIKKKMDKKKPENAPTPPAKAKKATHRKDNGKKYLKASSLTGAFRRWAIKRIDDDHPLSFLLVRGANNKIVKPKKWYKPKSDKHHDLFIDPKAVDGGHNASKKSVGDFEHEFVMIQERYSNRGPSSRLVEAPRRHGGFKNRPCIDIGGIPVDLESARYWVKKEYLDAKWVENATISGGWNNGPPEL